MATRKSTTKPSTSRRKHPTGGPYHIDQVDDPIIIKGGGSLVIEMDKNFRAAHTPSHSNMKGHKHPDATRITYVVLLDKKGKVKTRLQLTDEDDQVMICYKNPANGCFCP